MMYVITAILAASVGLVISGIFAANRLGDLLADLTLEQQSRLAIEQELLDLQARAYVRNERGHFQRLTNVN